MCWSKTFFVDNKICRIKSKTDPNPKYRKFSFYWTECEISCTFSKVVNKIFEKKTENGNERVFNLLFTMNVDEKLVYSTKIIHTNCKGSNV